MLNRIESEMRPSIFFLFAKFFAYGVRVSYEKWHAQVFIYTASIFI